MFRSLSLIYVAIAIRLWYISEMSDEKFDDEWDELADIIEMFKQYPYPLPHKHPFGTPSPEDALIEAIDNNKKDDGDDDEAA